MAQLRRAAGAKERLKNHRKVNADFFVTSRSPRIVEVIESVADCSYTTCARSLDRFFCFPSCFNIVQNKRCNRSNSWIVPAVDRFLKLCVCIYLFSVTGSPESIS